MSESPQTSRRSMLKMLAGAPLFPLTGLGAGSILAGCSSDNPTVTLTSTAFVGIPAPSLAAPGAMATVTSGSSLEVKFNDATTISYKFTYQPLLVTGDLVADGKGGSVVAGGYFDINNRPILDTSVPGKERQFFSDCPDGMSLITLASPTVTGIKGKAVFAVVQYEYATRNLAGANRYGFLPSPIAVLTLDQDQSTGKLSLVKYHNVDTSPAKGIWIACGSSVSPWGTHLGSEEYEPDAQFNATNTLMKEFSKNLYGDENAANPYHYGHMPEVTVNPDGTGTIKKHYCMGRISHELIQVMPDSRTALMGDDYTNGGLFVFVADRERDLSSGTLYVAKFGTGFSLDPSAAGAAVSWIKLGSATSAEIEAMANTLKPADIMTVVKTDPNDPTYTKMYCDGVANWVKLKPQMDKAAAFLETHRYANLKGASMGLTKSEGQCLNIKDKIAYTALQNMQSSMVRGNAAWNPNHNVTIEKALVAGGILAHTLAGGQKDTDGNTINSEWMPVLTKTLLTGEDIPADALGNIGHPDKIAAPDNLKFSEKLRTLFIGEDSGQHVNNFVWAYDVDTKKLTRLASMPSGAESTGLGVYDDINGWTYITGNFQHVGDWSSSLHAKVQATLDPLVRANYKDRYAATVGYLSADPTAVKLRRT